jgi:glycosyltransferase involved in cell wall biosynthesis
VHTATNPEFSVIMPAFNAEATIGAAIRSVLGQSRTDFELIVVNDGSTDGTEGRVEPFLRDPRVSLLSQRNHGMSAARNLGIARARGAYVSLLDSDDVWLPNYLEAMGRCLRGTDATVAAAYTDAWVLDEQTRKIKRRSAMSRWHPSEVPREPERFLWTLLERGNYIFVGTTIRRSVFDDVGAFRTDLDASEDYELWLRIVAHGYRFVRCASNLALYRRSPGQLSADEPRLLRAYANVYRLVAEEYDVTDDVRELASRRYSEQRQAAASFGPRRRVLRIGGWMSRLRHFRLRPPRQVRDAFPDLHAL